MKSRYFVASALLLLASCATHVESNPSRTASEQMLISTAADRAANKLAVTMQPNAKVFVDASNFEGTDSKYAIGAIRAALLNKGAALVADRKDAELVVEARSGALSTDQSSFLIGIPAFNIPIPLSSGSLPFPEIALYKNAEQKGVAKFAVAGYRANSGTLVTAQEPQYGFSYRDEITLLIFISWTDTDAIQDENSIIDLSKAH
jgi:hypothetical protein